MPPTPGIEYCITSNEALELPHFPRRIVVVGGGYVAVEFAGIFHSLGAEVTMILRGPLSLRGFDQDVREHLAAALTQRGTRIVSNSEVDKIEKRTDGLYSHIKNTAEIIVSDQVLYASGRAPNTASLGLQEVGVRLSSLGAVNVDEWSRTSVPNIYAVGDVTDRQNLTPVAINVARPENNSIVPSAFIRAPPKNS